MKCPNCGLVNPETASRCDCGHDFATRQMRESYSTATLSMDAGRQPSLRVASYESSNLPRTSSRTILPQVAGVLYLLFAVYALVLGALQLVLGLSSAAGSGIVELPNGAANTISVGVVNLVVSVIDVIIAAYLFRRSRRAWKWGLVLAVLSIPIVSLNGGVNCLHVLAFAYGTAAIVLWISRGEFKTREEEDMEDLRRTQVPGPVNTVPVDTVPVAAPPRQRRPWAVVLFIVLGLCGLSVFGCVGLTVVGLVFGGPSSEYQTSSRSYATATAVLDKVSSSATRSANTVQCDGLYRRPADTTGTSGKAYYNYLRFYEDGTVLDASVAESDPSLVAQWLDSGGGLFSHGIYPKGSTPIKRGHYSAEGSQLKFSLTGLEYGSVDFNGTIEGQVLTLNWYRPSNNLRGTEVYRFVALTGTPVP